MIAPVLRKIRRAVLYVLYLLVVGIAIVYVVFWRPWKKELGGLGRSEPDAFESVPNLPRETLLRVGSILTDHPSSFSRFPLQKPDGRIRLCAIGDSFTFGADVAEGLDYPTLLSRRFVEAGIANVDVVNLGNSWHGMSQAYVLWAEVARPMGCDFILVGPQSFYWDRDVSPSHSHDTEPRYLHSLYVLERDGSLKRVDVRGATRDERYDDYYRFLPRFDFLRYDFEPPPVLRSLLPHGRTVANPFYFRRGEEIGEYTHELWAAILRDIAERSGQVVLTNVSPRIGDLGAALDHPRLASLPIDARSRFPYRGPYRHYSGWGNQRLADIYFSLLVRGEEAAVPAIELRDVPPAENGAAADAIELSTLGDLEIASSDRTVGHLVVASPGAPGERYVPRLDSGPESLLVVAGEATPWLLGAFLRVPSALLDGDVVRIVAASGEQVGEEAQLVRLARRLPLYGVRVEGFRWHDNDVLMATARELLGQEDPRRFPAELALEIRGTVMLRGSYTDDGERYLFRGTGAEPLVAAAGESSFGDARSLEEGESVDLVGHTRGGDTVREPIATWHLERERLSPVRGHVRQRLECRPPLCRIVVDQDQASVGSQGSNVVPSAEAAAIEAETAAEIPSSR